MPRQTKYSFRSARGTFVTAERDEYFGAARGTFVTAQYDEYSEKISICYFGQINICYFGRIHSAGRLPHHGLR